MIHTKKIAKKVTKRRAILGALSLLLLVLLVAAACGEDATPTSVPSTATSVPPTAVPDTTPDATATAIPSQVVTATPEPSGDAPTAMPEPEPTAMAEPTAMPDEPTAMPEPTGLRSRDQWTEAEPATFEELEAHIEEHRGESFVFTSWGGAYQAAQRQAYIVPYQEQFGIDIVEESPMEYAKIRAMVETQNFSWNVIDVGGRALWAEIAVDSLAPLDMSIVDNRNHVGTVRTVYGGGGGITWSTVLAYNTDVYPDNPPTSWADYFDRDKFPGRRGVRDAYRGSWLMAGLALHPDWLDDPTLRQRLGQPTEADIQDYLDFWDQNKPDLFWHTGSDCPQMLISGELDMCSAWNGRIFDAQQAGEPLGIAWEAGHLVGTGLMVMPKGLKEVDPDAFEAGQRFIAWTGHPQINAEQSKYITYGPVNIRGAEYMDGPEYNTDSLPTSAANAPYAVIENEKFSGEWNDRWTEMWQGYMQRQ